MSTQIFKLMLRNHFDSPVYRGLLTFGIISCFVAAWCTKECVAQPPGFDRDRGGDRGEDRGSDRGGPPGGGMPPPDRIFDFMDRNRDGKLTKDETERMPSSVRDNFKKFNLDLDRGVTKDQYIQAAPKMFEEFRKQREEESRRREDESSKDSNNNSSKDSNKKDASKNSNIWVPPKRDRVTMDLSKNYSSLDTDTDDQIGLYEWRQANKGTVAQFDEMDLNHDGFLTPKEIEYFEKKPKPAGSTTTVAKVTPAPATTSSSSNSEKPSSKEIAKMEKKAEKSEKAEKSSQDNSEEKALSEATYVFGVLDKNKDGMVNPDEWSISKKLKPSFEQANIDISKDMSKEDFLANYLKVGSGWRK